MARNTFVIGKQYEVKWKDHFSDSAWKALSEIEDWVKENSKPCTTRGTVIYQDDEILVLSASDDGGGNYGDLMAIYKNHIVKKRRL